MIFGVVESSKRASEILKNKFKHLRREDVEDFRQYCAEEYLKGRNLKTPFSHLYVDYFRIYGVSKKRRQNGKQVLSSADALNQPDNVSDDCLLTEFTKDNINAFIEAEDLRGHRADRIDRATLILHFEWGFKLKEIADLFDMTPEYITKRLRITLNTIKDRLKK